MKKVFQWLMGFSFLCLFTVFIFVLSLIFDNLTVSQLLLNFGEIAICAWALYFGIKFVDVYNEKQLREKINNIENNINTMCPDPIMICEDMKKK